MASKSNCKIARKEWCTWIFLSILISFKKGLKCSIFSLLAWTFILDTRASQPVAWKTFLRGQKIANSNKELLLLLEVKFQNLKSNFERNHFNLSRVTHSRISRHLLPHIK
uniref:Uncharacterized protein n=1 Tax=Cacopsylla melanoneura TaxID=428564 RepID=A0A8D8YTH1_9HEMI